MTQPGPQDSKRMEWILSDWMRYAPDGQHLQLLGQRCRSCGVHFFPRTSRCKACSSTELEAAALGPEGELHSVTTDRMGTFLGRPHLVGQIRFDEGAFVQGFVDAEPEHEPPIGCRVALVPFEVPVSRNGETALTYALRPVESARA